MRVNTLFLSKCNHTFFLDMEANLLLYDKHAYGTQIAHSMLTYFPVSELVSLA